jgi:hypothetical protein
MRRCSWLMSGYCFWRGRSCLFEDTIPAFAPRDCGKLRKLSMKMSGSLAEIWPGYLSDKKAIVLPLQYCSRSPERETNPGPCACPTPYLRTLCRRVRRIVACILEFTVSSFERKRDNGLSWFSVLCFTISTYFPRFTLLASVWFQNVFCFKSNLNCSWFPNFKPVSRKFVLMDIMHFSTQVTVFCSWWYVY